MSYAALSGLTPSSHRTQGVAPLGRKTVSSLGERQVKSYPAGKRGVQRILLAILKKPVNCTRGYAFGPSFVAWCVCESVLCNESAGIFIPAGRLMGPFN